MAVSDRTGPGGEQGDAAQLALDDDDAPLPWLVGDDDDDEDYGGANTGQLIGLLVLGLLALAAVGGGIWWVTSKSGEDVLVADGSTIEAPAEPYKQRPENPGGKVFDGTGDSSFGISEGQKRPARLGEAPTVAEPGFTAVEKDAKPAATATAAAPAADKPAEPQVPGVGVQVAAYSNRDQAEAGWTRLSQQYEVLASARHRIVQGQADIGTVYRLQAVAPDLAGAKALCQQLKAAGLNCQVKN